MKKFCSLLLVLCLLFSLSACGNDNSQKELVDEAIKELKSTWEDIYDESKSIKTDGYFEIKNTRVIEIMKNDIEEFEDVDCIIEFVLYTDYFGAAPYYSYAGTSDSVIVYDSGDMEVSGINLLRAYSAKHYTYDYSDIIKTVNDYGDEFNCVEKLK